MVSSEFLVKLYLCWSAIRFVCKHLIQIAFFTCIIRGKFSMLCVHNVCIIVVMGIGCIMRYDNYVTTFHVFIFLTMAGLVKYIQCSWEEGV